MEGISLLQMFLRAMEAVNRCEAAEAGNRLWWPDVWDCVALTRLSEGN